MSAHWWAVPAPGDIVWCRFPTGSPTVRPKARPALVLDVDDSDPREPVVRVAYGISQGTAQLFAGEFLIAQAEHRAAYAAAGLSYDTKFDVCNTAWLPYRSDVFGVAPGSPYGQTPQLGILHASMMRAAAAAHATCPGES